MEISVNLYITLNVIYDLVSSLKNKKIEIRYTLVDNENWLLANLYVLFKGRRQNSLSVTTNKPHRMANVGDWAYVTQICQWAPAEAMWQVTYAGWG